MGTLCLARHLCKGCMKMVSDSSSAPELIGAKIMRLRKERRISQDRLSIQAHVDQSGLSKFERGGERAFAPQSLSRIAKVLGLTLDELVAGTDWSQAAAQLRQSHTPLK